MKKSLFGLVALLLAAMVFMGCPMDGDSGGDTRKELTAGSAIEVATSSATATVTFIGASGLSLSAADFAVDNGASVTNASVSGNTATVSVSFVANTDASPKTYTVSIASGSMKIKGSTTVLITQAGVSASDTRVELTAGSAVEVAASDTSKAVTFTGASGLSLSAADFTVDNGASVTNASVSGNTATVSVSFAANTGATPKTYTVSIASGSTKIKGSTTVLITQVKVGDTPDARKELIAGSAIEVAASSTTATVSFIGASGLSLSAADFTVDNGASVTNASVSGNTATVSVSFAANTGATPKTYTVSIAEGSTKIKGSATVAITQVVAGPAVAVNAFDLTSVVITPAVTDVPVTTAINTAQYTGTVAWYTSGLAFSGPTFAASTAYRALVTLTAKPGYTFAGVAANSFIYMGSTEVSNGVSSGLVTITFPATAASGSANITVDFNYGEITITGSDGSNVISKSGDYGATSLSLSATGYIEVIWYVDGSLTGISGSPITLNAAIYSAQQHSIIFTGTANGRRYSSQPIPFAVLP